MFRVLFSIHVWTYYVLLFSIFVVLISITFILTFFFDPYHRYPNKVLGMMAWCMMHPSSSWEYHMEGVEKYDASKPTIFIANHQSFMDIPFAYQLPWKMKWVVKQSMAFIPIMGWLVVLTGQLTINRSSKSALKKLSNLVKPLKNSVPVMIFPEGTRSLDGEVKAFKNGAFLLAMEHGFNIQPVVIDGAHDALPSGSKLFNTKCSFKLSILDPIDPKNFTNMNELKTHARELIIDELKRLKST